LDRQGPFDPLNRCCSSTSLASRLADTFAVHEQLLDGFNPFVGHRRATQAFVTSDTIEPCHDAISNHGSFELTEDAQKLEQHAPGGRACIESLLVKIKIDAACLHVTEECNEVLKRSAQAVHAPCADQVELLAGDTFNKASKPGR
jgi:hypothetical protein